MRSSGRVDGDAPSGRAPGERDLRLRGAVLDRVGLGAIPTRLPAQRLRGHQRHAGDQGTGDGAVRERSPALSPSPLARGTAGDCTAMGECGGSGGGRGVSADSIHEMR